MKILTIKQNRDHIALLLFILLSLFSGSVKAQQFSKKVHEIKKVQIVSSRSNFYSEDQKTYTFDSLTINNNQTENLSGLLSSASPLFIKSYGSRGSLATPNLRGTPGTHTSLTWNGFPINSLTLGQCDLSLTPMEFIDDVSITHSAPGSLYGNGTFGGAIGLENKVNWKKIRSLSLSSEMGSWGNQRYGLQSELGNNTFHTKFSAFFQKAENDFEYRDIQQFGKPIEERKNNAVENFGLMQNFYYKISPRNKFEAGVWYQERKKELPELMGTSQRGSARQQDSILRIYGKWNKVLNESSLQVRTGYFYHHQLYSEKETPGDESYMIYSPIETRKWMNDLNYRLYLSNQISLDLGGQYSLLQGEVKAYGDKIREYRASLIGALKYERQQLTTNLSLRKQFNKYTDPVPQVGIGGNYRLIPDKLYIRSHFSTKYRLPTMNDKYWQPGGNKDLNPEHGWSAELGLGHDPELAEAIQKFHTEITVYTSKIHELIQWIPANGESYWHAINTSRVRSSGIELSADMHIQWNNFKINLKSLYNYTRSVNLNKEKPQVYNKQLRYTPYHTIKNTLYTNWKEYSMGTNIKYTGKRYATADNSRTLDPYSIMDVFVKRQFELENFKAQLKFTVQNVFDREYQVIAFYPMPGRAYYINLKIQLNKLIN